MTLKVIKTERNVVINLLKIEKELAVNAGIKASPEIKSTLILGSSNGIYGCRQVLRSEEEYEEIYRHMGNEEFTIDDMKWIDVNVFENPAIQG